MIIDDAASINSLSLASDLYEAALLVNDLIVLDRYFWQDTRVERIGPEGEQCGAEAARLARASWSLADLPRERLSRHISGFSSQDGSPFAGVVNIVFRRTRDGRIGRQSQTWMHISGAWRIVAAHVSFREEPHL